MITQQVAKTGVSSLPAELLRHTISFLKAPQLWPLRLVDKRFYENVMEMAVQRVQDAFTKDGWVMKFEVSHIIDAQLSLLCNFRHIDPKNNIARFTFSGPTPNSGAVPTKPCTLLSRTLVLPSELPSFSISVAFVRVAPATGKIVRVIDGDEVTVNVSGDMTINETEGELSRLFGVKHQVGCIEMEVDVRCAMDKERELAVLMMGERGLLMIESANCRVFEFLGVGCRAEWVLDLLEEAHSDKMSQDERLQKSDRNT
ncbi:hypothetical protein BC936DRAFT_139471 [Jimgerdemannia flammicorona]|uniref:F-box domain-containing protein n=1 Tax=Jimgerdemannia flammicorona TaxID=994334 RepID=A0A433B9U8_9FUNG|nr:hypothetical protein BC936DRAFT_139471 [Jimgerdemannia flammicorona]